MSNYHIEAATKEEWAERALYAEAKLIKALKLFEEIIELQRCEFSKVRSIITELKDD